MKHPFCHHIHVVCRELEPMIRFWQTLFEAKVEGYCKFGAYDGARLDIRAGEAKLFLKAMGAEAAAPAKATICGLDHLGMMVADLDATLEAAKKYPCVTIAREPFMSGSLRCAFIRDPEGIPLEVMQDMGQ